MAMISEDNDNALIESVDNWLMKVYDSVRKQLLIMDERAIPSHEIAHNTDLMSGYDIAINIDNMEFHSPEGKDTVTHNIQIMCHKIMSEIGVEYVEDNLYVVDLDDLYDVYSLFILDGARLIASVLRAADACGYIVLNYNGDITESVETMTLHDSFDLDQFVECMSIDPPDLLEERVGLIKQLYDDDKLCITYDKIKRYYLERLKTDDKFLSDVVKYIVGFK